MAKVLVTGSQGTLGKPLVRELRRRGHEVWGTDLQHQADPQYVRADVAEYRVRVDQAESLPVLRIEVEPLLSVSANGLAERISRAIRDELLFRAEVTTVATGTLPRFEMKARRIVLTPDRKD